MRMKAKQNPETLQFRGFVELVAGLEPATC